jgi:hypothetical protein
MAKTMKSEDLSHLIYEASNKYGMPMKSMVRKPKVMNMAKKQGKGDKGKGGGKKGC